MNLVPVIDANQTPLMPTKAKQARKWIESGRAAPFWKRGVFCVRLNFEPSGRIAQPIAVGIDPGSKKEAFTVKSEAHTYLNIQVDAVTWVKQAVTQRRELRRARRGRKTPYRHWTGNGTWSGLPPSTRARWGWKLRIVRWLKKMYPVSHFVVENVSAPTKKNCRKWNRGFCPLEYGRDWFYGQLKELGDLETKSGWDTYEMRLSMGLKKSKDKQAEIFSAHCVDSWVLANSIVGGHVWPDNQQMLLMSPLRLHRRQLHLLQPEKGGVRRPYGSTQTCGFKRGALVKHYKLGVVYVGGFCDRGMTLISLETGKRISRRGNPAKCKFLAYNSWRAHFLKPREA